MKLTFLRGECADGRTCPNLNITDRGTFVVQGYRVTTPEHLASLALDPHESVVEVPLSLLPELADSYDDSRSTVFIRGATVRDVEALAELNLPPDECAVEVPMTAFPRLREEVADSAR